MDRFLKTMTDYWLLGELLDLDEHGYWDFKLTVPIHISKYTDFMDMTMQHRNVSLETIHLVSDIVMSIEIADEALIKMRGKI